MTPESPLADLTTWREIIRDLGFPAFVALYLLFRLDRLLVELRDKITTLIYTVTLQAPNRKDPPP